MLEKGRVLFEPKTKLIEFKDVRPEDKVALQGFDENNESTGKIWGVVQAVSENTLTIKTRAGRVNEYVFDDDKVTQIWSKGTNAETKSSINKVAIGILI